MNEREEEDQKNSGYSHQRSVNYRQRKGTEEEYPVAKEHLDFILDGIRHMPDPGKIVEPLGWLLVGIGGTAGFEAYNSVAGSEHRHSYVLLAIFAALAGFVCLFCDRKLNKEERKQAKWLEKYVVDLYGAFGLSPPEVEPRLLRRCWDWCRGRAASVSD